MSDIQTNREDASNPADPVKPVADVEDAASSSAKQNVATSTSIRKNMDNNSFSTDIRNLKFFTDTSKWLLGALSGILFFSYDKFNCVKLRENESYIALFGILLFFITYHHYARMRDIVQEKLDLTESVQDKKTLLNGPPEEFKYRKFLAWLYRIALASLVVYSWIFLFHNESACGAKKEKAGTINNFYSATNDGRDSSVTVNDTIPCEPVVLKNVLFIFDTDTLLKSSLPVLDSFAIFLKSNPKIEIELSAHTDDWGSYNYNMGLNMRRASAIVSYLIGKEISPGRLVSRGCGEFMPIATNSTEEGRQLNRRVEFRIIKTG